MFIIVDYDVRTLYKLNLSKIVTKSLRSTVFNVDGCYAHGRQCALCTIAIYTADCGTLEATRPAGHDSNSLKRVRNWRALRTRLQKNAYCALGPMLPRPSYCKRHCYAYGEP